MWVGFLEAEFPDVVLWGVLPKEMLLVDLM